MLAIKRGNASTARTILEFGVDSAVLLLRDVDGSTPLHVATQKGDPVLPELVLKYGPTQLLYTENSVGQMPMDIASLKGFPRLTGGEITGPMDLILNVESDIEQYLRTPQKAPPFNVDKQKIEIQKLRATLNMLLADGRIKHGTKLTTELLAFADRMERRLVEEIALKNAAENHAEDAELDRPEPQGATTRTYFALRDAAAVRPGTRRLVHLADVQRSVRWNLAQPAEGTLVRRSQLSPETDEEHNEADPEYRRIAELKARSLFASGSQVITHSKHVDLHGEDQL